jgi:hypothetical protein
VANQVRSYGAIFFGDLLVVACHIRTSEKFGARIAGSGTAQSLVRFIDLRQ